MDSKQKLPTAFWAAWMVELWERFGYYAVSGLVALYFAQKLGYTQEQSIVIYSTYTSVCYGFVYLGGWIGDKILGTKTTIILGALFLAGAYALLAMSNKDNIFLALGAIGVGSSLFKANPSSIISKIFSKGSDQDRLDGAMTLYYMAVNIGSLISLSLGPIIADKFGYQYAFGCASGGLLLGTIGFIGMSFKMNVPDTATPTLPKIMSVFLALSIATFIEAWLMKNPNIAFYTIWVVVAVAVSVFLSIALKLKGIEKNRMLVALLLIGGGIIFFILYMQMGGTLTFLALNSMTLPIPAAMYQSLNALIIVIASPILAKFVYPHWKVSHATKFSVGFLLSGIAFGGLYFMQYFSDGMGHISALWMLWCYTFQSIGELLTSALGVAMISELCPREISGFSMGMWYLSTMLAGPIAASIGKFTAVPPHVSNQIHLVAYANTFGVLGFSVLCVSMIIFLFTKRLDNAIGHGQYKEE